MTKVSRKQGTEAFTHKAATSIIEAGINSLAINNTLIGTISSRYLATKPLKDRHSVDKIINNKGGILIKLTKKGGIKPPYRI
ncbi:hypothetical protein GCM10007931_07280 [Vibrio algivorus]|uniref:Uncharacterized protein n=1 Tax=Vibrio algivorus TaxID=1667024 RepID=A0ABQ6EL82_9VIBR|nr:hypothetical protein GCM10007931_07280 [Vibrio algivorus]